jgi:stage V sporulation protein B
VHELPDQEKPRTESEQVDQVVRRAGRGGLAVSIAKAYFIFVGLVQNILLPRVLGASGYGGLSRVLSFTSIAYNSVVTTSIQGASRTVARAGPHERPFVIRKVLKFHALAAPAIGLLMWGIAPLVGRALNATHLIPALRIMSGVFFFYSLYAPLVGVLNGQQRFVWQAGLDICFATLRTAALVVGAWWLKNTSGQGIEGAVVGFVSVTAIITLVAAPIAGLGKSGSSMPSARLYVGFILPLLAGQVLLNSLLQLDITLLGRFASDAAHEAHVPIQQADALVGSYRATQNFSFLPYQLLLSITFILFPLLAQAHREGKSSDVALYVSSGIRLALIIAGALISVTAGIPGALLRLIYRPEIADPAVRSMSLLTLGFGAFAILGILTTILTSLQRERAGAVITGLAVALVVVLAVLTVRGQPFGVDLLWRMAIATCTGLVLATVAAGMLVYRAAGALVSPLSAVRVVTSLSASIFAGRLLAPRGAMTTLGSAVVLVCIYFVLLVALRELNRSDLQHVAIVLKRRGASR